MTLDTLLALARLLELNVSDSNVRACIVAAYYHDGDNNVEYEKALLSAYRSQNLVLLNAVKNTQKYKELTSLLDAKSCKKRRNNMPTQIMQYHF